MLCSLTPLLYRAFGNLLFSLVKPRGFDSPVLFVAMVAALLAVFIYAPTEREMGIVQRIYYFHVPSAISAAVAFLIVFASSILYLWRREDRFDALARSAAEVGVLFSAIVLITGPIWAKPIWGVFWRWEPRLTTMLILFTMYVAYLMLRTYGSRTEQTQRFAAVFGILSFVNVPLVHYSVKLWAPEQQLHPIEVMLDPRMAQVRGISYLAVFLLLRFLLQRRFVLEQMDRAIFRLRRQLEGSN
jgi:heme exporter protein C